jgi:hypothetical protein
MGSDLFISPISDWDTTSKYSYGKGREGKVTTSRVMVASRLKVSFWPEGNTSPRNYGWLFVTWIAMHYSRSDVLMNEHGMLLSDYMIIRSFFSPQFAGLSLTGTARLLDSLLHPLQKNQCVTENSFFCIYRKWTKESKQFQIPDSYYLYQLLLL